MSIYSDHHIVIFDDDAFTAKLLESVLLNFDVGKVSIMQNADEIRLYLTNHHVDCVMMEWFGWEHPSLELLKYIRTSGKVVNSTMPVIMCTGYTDYNHIVRARDAGANEVVAKPISPKHVFEKLYNAMFKVREFIADDAFTGPDRRRHSGPFNGEDRRAGASMSQGDIDQVMIETHE